ncbi:hypothetical protein BIW11_13154 [Tropilaelaps mercedesae]|uniref:Uncharacterized protein n=1 Tax=Tropilaelaps mercedesae TaxID=418985 RepID=A0A1V9X3S4_9ACAR|nr:hypothetical protein BIW11_13154 [Tropilaelaps mercedesae]
MLILTTALFFVVVPAQKYFDKCFYGVVLKECAIPNPLQYSSDATIQLTSLMQRLDSFYLPLDLDLLTNIVPPIRTLVNGIASFTLADETHFFIDASYSTAFSHDELQPR